MRLRHSAVPVLHHHLDSCMPILKCKTHVLSSLWNSSPKISPTYWCHPQPLSCMLHVVQGQRTVHVTIEHGILSETLSTPLGKVCIVSAFFLRTVMSNVRACQNLQHDACWHIVLAVHLSERVTMDRKSRELYGPGMPSFSRPPCVLCSPLQKLR